MAFPSSPTPDFFGALERPGWEVFLDHPCSNLQANHHKQWENLREFNPRIAKNTRRLTPDLVSEYLWKDISFKVPTWSFRRKSVIFFKYIPGFLWGSPSFKPGESPTSNQSSKANSFESQRDVLTKTSLRCLRSDFFFALRATCWSLIVYVFVQFFSIETTPTKCPCFKANFQC